MALVDTTIVVDPSNVIVSTTEGQSITVSPAVLDITVAGAAGIRGPQGLAGGPGPEGPKGDTGDSGLQDEMVTDITAIYRLST